MRDRLQRIEGQRKEFKAVFVRFGVKTNFKGYAEKTVLLHNVVCTTNRDIACDHLWFNYTKEFQKLELSEGMVLKFQARVKEYTKGYRGYREDDGFEHPVEIDYRLSHPTKIRVVTSVNKSLKGV